MNRLRLLLSSLAFSVLATSVMAQGEIDLNVGGGWVLNNNLDEDDSIISTAFGDSSCQTNDKNTAKVEWEIKHRTGPTIGEDFRVIGSARYSGEAHQNCDLPGVTASASKSGNCHFVHSSTGGFSFDLSSDADVTSSRDPHANGAASAQCTINLYGILILPPGLHPPYSKTVSNSASSSGLSAPAISNFANTTGTKNNRNNFTVTGSVVLSSSIDLPPVPSGPPDDALEVLWARPSSSSSITLF